MKYLQYYSHVCIAHLISSCGLLHTRSSLLISIIHKDKAFFAVNLPSNRGLYVWLTNWISCKASEKNRLLYICMQIINLLFDFVQKEKYTRGRRSQQRRRRRSTTMKNKTLDRNNKQNLICFSLPSILFLCLVLFSSISMSKTSLACASKVENRNENIPATLQIG